MNAERILVATECIGDGRWLHEGHRVRQRPARVRARIGQNQGVQFPLAQAFAELEAADMMCRRAAALFAAGQPCGADANMAKLLASEATWQAAEVDHRDPRWFRVRAGIRCRAEMARGAYLPHRPHFDQHGARLRCPARARPAALILI